MPAIPFNIRCIIPSAATNGVLAAFEERTPPGGGPPLHTHRTQIEIFHVIRGRYLFVLGEERMELAAGDSAVIPAGAIHAFKNIGGTEGLLHFEILPPENIEEFFDRLVMEFDATGDPSAFFNEYGMNLDGPPLA